MEIFKDPKFKKAFWYWFDNILTEDERKAFYNYPMDTAELYFFNQVFKKIMEKQND